VIALHKGFQRVTYRGIIPGKKKPPQKKKKKDRRTARITVVRRGGRSKNAGEKDITRKVIREGKTNIRKKGDPQERPHVNTK